MGVTSLVLVAVVYLSVTSCTVSQTQLEKEIRIYDAKIFFMANVQTAFHVYASRINIMHL